jgi:SAM-dependent methyltransferase
MKIATEKNVDDEVARGFGDEWSKFRQDETNLAHDERETIFQNYFRIFPWDLLPPGGGIGADIGCGTGRWAKMVAPRVAHLHLLDASPDALAVARENLENVTNVSFDVGTVGAIPLPDRSLDFAFSLVSGENLASALRRAEAAHGQHEKRTGQRDANWANWYAAYIVAEQTGQELPQ